MPTLAEQIAALNLPEMTEAEVAAYCGLSEAQYAKYKQTVTRDDAAFCQQARAIEMLAPMWAAGVEPFPSDVSVNRGRGKVAMTKAEGSS